MAISKSKPRPPRVHIAIHVVNIREKMVPPMPMHSFRNLVFYAAAILSPHDDDDGILVNKLSNAIQGINGDFVKKLQSDVIPDSLTKGVKLSSAGDMEMYKFQLGADFLFMKLILSGGSQHGCVFPLCLSRTKSS